MKQIFSRTNLAIAFYCASLLFAIIGIISYLGMNSAFTPFSREDGMFMGLLGFMGIVLISVRSNSSNTRPPINNSVLPTPIEINEEVFATLRLAAPGLFQARKFGVTVSLPTEVRQAILARHGDEAQHVFDLLDGNLNLSPIVQ